jgi:hypothetical protein
MVVRAGVSVSMSIGLLLLRKDLSGRDGYNDSWNCT